MNYVLCDGPWIIGGQYLAIQKWKSGFNTIEDRINHLTVWVRVTGLHGEWFDPQYMKRIEDLIGTNFHVDLRTTSRSRGKYARIFGELDL